MISPTSLFGAPTYNAGGLGGAGLSGAYAPSPGLSNPLSQTSMTNPLANPFAMGGMTGTAGDGSMSGMLQQIVSMLMTIMSMLMSMLQGGNANQGTPSFDRGNPEPFTNSNNGGGITVPTQLSHPQSPPTGGTKPTAAQSDSLITGIKNTTSDPTQKQRLNTTLAKVAQDPDGAKLLKAAEANGYTIEVGDPTKAGSQDHDADSVNGVTLPDQKKIIINPNAPDFDKTVVHELVHAATPTDGNSKTEEGMADVIGYRVSSRMDGRQMPGSEQQIFSAKANSSSYSSLQSDNGIINDLNKLGISA